MCITDQSQINELPFTQAVSLWGLGRLKGQNDHQAVLNEVNKKSAYHLEESADPINISLHIQLGYCAPAEAAPLHCVSVIDCYIGLELRVAVCVSTRCMCAT
jgi:hypothetical protein